MENGEQREEQHGRATIIPVSGMYENWFLDYASYVILERAVPAIEDGLKPVQRRILHAMKEMDDGRFNKVANIIGSTMQYHPHGDASINDAIVNLGQKDLLIETQGNWGDIRTGDSAAASRYIEARLSKFALEVVFNPQTTPWQVSYDGRKREPVTLPVKFPLLLAQGADGIAVGLATKILPHNFCELIEASVKYLKGKPFVIYPDFPTGGLADVSNYNEGQKGGKIRIRAKIEAIDAKTLIIRDIPFTTTTLSVIESIVKANDQGKIKIKKVVDNTAKDVEIEVQLQPGQSPDVTIEALYAFTECEVSVSPNCCIIYNNKPRFVSVHEVLKTCTDQTVVLLRRELEIRQNELLEKILFSSLEKIFIENRIYRDIEHCETWEAVLQTIDQGLGPFKKNFYREITRDDIIKLTEIKIKRISRFDAFKADEIMKGLEDELAQVNANLANLIEHAIAYYTGLIKKYGKGRERKTEIAIFDTITATKVAANNTKLYVNRQDGFIGFGLKKDEFVCDCSDIDDIIVFKQDGKFQVTKIAEKTFVGKGILHVEVFVKGDERRVYNMAYLDAKTGATRVKRFQVLGITRDKEYDLTTGNKGSKVLYFTSNPNGEAEIIGITLSPGSKAKIKVFEYNFADLDIKGRNSQGNILTKYPVRKIVLKKEGVSTLSAMSLWYDDSIGKLNKDAIGAFLGKFNEGDKILVIYQNGEYELTNYELTNRYDPKQVYLLCKLNNDTVITTIHYDGNNKEYYVKRFQIETTSLDKKFSFISEAPGSKMVMATVQKAPVAELQVQKGKETQKTVLALHEFIDVKGWKALGNKLNLGKVVKAKLISQDTLPGSADGQPEEGTGEDEQDQLKLFDA